MERACETYERLIAVNSDAAATLGDWHDLVPRNISEIARTNLAQLDGLAPDWLNGKGRARVAMEEPVLAQEMGSAMAADAAPGPWTHLQWKMARTTSSVALRCSSV